MLVTQDSVTWKSDATLPAFVIDQPTNTMAATIEELEDVVEDKEWKNEATATTLDTNKQTKKETSTFYILSLLLCSAVSLN